MGRDGGGGGGGECFGKLSFGLTEKAKEQEAGAFFYSLRDLGGRQNIHENKG